MVISKLVKMNKVLKEKRESIIKIKELNGNKLPFGLLLKG